MLNEFLVLGQVPGTNFQITFNELVIVFAAAALAAAAYLFYRNKLFGRYFRRSILLARLLAQLFIESKKHRQLSLPL